MIASMYGDTVRLGLYSEVFQGMVSLGWEGKVRVQKRWLGLSLALFLAFQTALPAAAADVEGAGNVSAQADALSEDGGTGKEYEGEYAEGRAIVKVSGESSRGVRGALLLPLYMRH